MFDIKKCKLLTGNQLKIIALLSMIIDHIGFCVFYRCLIYWNVKTPINVGKSELFMVYNLCNKIGRIAFPLYCFLLVEGFKHTRNIRKYALRLLTMAIISEPWFDLAFGGQLIVPSHQNVLFSLFVGLITIYLMSLCDRQFRLIQIKENKDNKNVSNKGIGIHYYKKYFFVVLEFLIPCAFAILANIIHLDYRHWGILLIALLYVVDFYCKNMLLAIGCGSLLFAFYIWRSNTFNTGLIAFIIMLLYSGNKGVSNKILSRGFYLSYPIHLIILYFVAKSLGIGSYNLIV